MSVKRRMAKPLGLNVAGVLGILARGRREGRIAILQAAILDLREKAGFHIGNELFAELAASAGEDIRSIS